MNRPYAQEIAGEWAKSQRRANPWFTQKQAEWLGAVLGLMGSLLIALNNPSISGYGFIAFLLSNVCWLLFGLKTKTWGLVSMQLGFTVTSLFGIYNWIL